MMKRLISVIVLFIFFGCKKEEKNDFPFDSFIFSYAGENYDNSIKFTKSDTVFLQRRFPSPKENFYAIINNEEKIKLNKFLQTINFKKFDSIYFQERLQDGTSYLINISKNGKNQMIHIYGDNAPEELYNFIDSLGKFKPKLKFLPTKKIIDFGNLSSILPPPPPPIKTK